MFAPVIPFLPALGGWLTGETAMVAGTAAVAGGATAVAVNKLRQQGDSQADADGDDPCPQCKPKHKQKCDALKKKMEGNANDILDKRLEDLGMNPNRQPWDSPGAPARDTVSGHVLLVYQQQAALLRDLQEYKRKNCGEPSKRMMQALQAEIPGNAGSMEAGVTEP